MVLAPWRESTLTVKRVKVETYMVARLVARLFEARIKGIEVVA